MNLALMLLFALFVNESMQGCPNSKPFNPDEDDVYIPRPVELANLVFTWTPSYYFFRPKYEKQGKRTGFALTGFRAEERRPPAEAEDFNLTEWRPELVKLLENNWTSLDLIYEKKSFYKQIWKHHGIHFKLNARLNKPKRYFREVLTYAHSVSVNKVIDKKRDFPLASDDEKLSLKKFSDILLAELGGGVEIICKQDHTARNPMVRNDFYIYEIRFAYSATNDGRFQRVNVSQTWTNCRSQFVWFFATSPNSWWKKGKEKSLIEDIEAQMPNRQPLDKEESDRQAIEDLMELLLEEKPCRFVDLCNHITQKILVFYDLHQQLEKKANQLNEDDVKVNISSFSARFGVQSNLFDVLKFKLNMRHKETNVLKTKMQNIRCSMDSLIKNMHFFNHHLNFQLRRSRTGSPESSVSSRSELQAKIAVEMSHRSEEAQTIQEICNSISMTLRQLTLDPSMKRKYSRQVAAVKEHLDETWLELKHVTTMNINAATVKMWKILQEVEAIRSTLFRNLHCSRARNVEFFLLKSKLLLYFSSRHNVTTKITEFMENDRLYEKWDAYSDTMNQLLEDYDYDYELSEQDVYFFLAEFGEVSERVARMEKTLELMYDTVQDIDPTGLHWKSSVEKQTKWLRSKKVRRRIDYNLALCKNIYHEIEEEKQQFRRNAENDSLWSGNDPWRKKLSAAIVLLNALQKSLKENKAEENLTKLKVIRPLPSIDFLMNAEKKLSLEHPRYNCLLFRIALRMICDCIEDDDLLFRTLKSRVAELKRMLAAMIYTASTEQMTGLSGKITNYKQFNARIDNAEMMVNLYGLEIDAIDDNFTDTSERMNRFEKYLPKLHTAKLLLEQYRNYFTLTTATDQSKTCGPLDAPGSVPGQAEGTASSKQASNKSLPSPKEGSYNPEQSPGE